MTPSPHSRAPKDASDPQVSLGIAVKAARLRLGVTQEELAWRADMHRTYVADIERGARNVTLRSITNLARALQVSAQNLLGDSLDVEMAARRSRGLGEVLLVEDSPNDAELALHAFKRAKFTNPVKVAKTGREALDYIFTTGRYQHREPVLPQLVLLDLNLPDMPGIAVLREIKADPRTRSIPVVILTVSSDDKSIIECGAAGAENYIIKPVAFENFSQVTPKLNLHWALLNPGTPTGDGSVGDGLAQAE